MTRRTDLLNEIHKDVERMVDVGVVEMLKKERIIRDLTEVIVNCSRFIVEDEKPCTICEQPTVLLDQSFNEHMHYRCAEERWVMEQERRGTPFEAEPF